MLTLACITYGSLYAATERRVGVNDEFDSIVLQLHARGESLSQTPSGALLVMIKTGGVLANACHELGEEVLIELPLRTRHGKHADVDTPE